MTVFICDLVDSVSSKASPLTAEDVDNFGTAQGALENTKEAQTEVSMESLSRTVITSELLKESGMQQCEVRIMQACFESMGVESSLLTPQLVRAAEGAGMPEYTLWCRGLVYLGDEERALSIRMGPKYAGLYARYVDKCPRDDTRMAACEDPYEAYAYAGCVDRCPRPDTRTAACKDPWYAYRYAYHIDQCPGDETREGACGEAESAYYYAKRVDEVAHPVTRRAVEANNAYKVMYEYLFDEGAGQWPH